jgi:hypothetical protein
MMADLFEIKESSKHGKGEKGLFATQFIPRGTIMDFRCKKCERTYSKKELAKLPRQEKRFVISHEVMRESGLYSKMCDKRMLYDNHSCNANTMGYKGFGIVVRDIEKGEEVTSDYRVDSEVDEVHFAGGCKCGERNCMGNTTFRPPALKELQKFWDRKINAALKLIPYVMQPLKGKLLKEHPELSYLFNPER